LSDEGGIGVFRFTESFSPGIWIEVGSEPVLSKPEEHRGNVLAVERFLFYFRGEEESCSDGSLLSTQKRGESQLDHN